MIYICFEGGGGGGGGVGARDGDWDCSCGTSNFASRRQCFKCSEPKPGIYMYT